MNYALAGQPYAFDFQTHTGLVGTVGVRVVSSAGVEAVSRTTAGIVEAPAGSGNYLGTVTAPAAAGFYAAVVDDGSATPNHVTSSTFEVVAAAVVVPPPAGGSVPGPLLGPCAAWINGEDVLGCCKSAQGVDPALLETFAVSASMALFEVSGRRFPGLCGPRVVRPCREPCSCWGLSSSVAPWLWGAGPGGDWFGWGWWNECGDRCGCGTLERVKLAGYPVREIVEVLIDGAAVDPSTYRLDGWKWLVRLDDPGPPVVKRYWPGCQNLSLDDTEPGTFSVTYRWGVDPPELGRLAAAEVACQLRLACQSADNCVLPQGATRVQRQGVTVDRGLLANWLDPQKPTGLANVDLFLRAYGGKGRRAAVFSPDVQPYARRVG